MEELPELEAIADRIIVVRGLRVMMDADLASLYGVPTKQLNQQVRRNEERFPGDFAFRLNAEEWTGLNRSQIVTGLHRTNSALTKGRGGGVRSQRHRNTAVLPIVFTEHGCLMLANVLRSGRAVQVSVLVVRAFVRIRAAMMASAELALRVEELSRELERQGGKLADHHDAIHLLLREIRRLTQFPESPKRGIGFTAPWSK
ncbi:MAG: ORF6N domain-containing protein [Pseudomonadota bacterium]|nr:ORF6N domain-containing protein [Pseudomonadota bacterium]